MRPGDSPAAPLPIDVDYLSRIMVELLRTPSPSGRTDQVMQLIGEAVTDLGVEAELTRRGSLSVDLRSADTPASRAVVVHADTIGCIVSRVKDTARLELQPIGTHSARFAEGARVTLFTDDIDRRFTGTILPLLASGHAYGDAVDDQGVGWDHVELRLDERVENERDVRALGIDVGDIVALDAGPAVTPAGFVVSRHLDDKAGVAAVLAACQAITDARCVLDVKAQVLVTISEELGHGASHGLRDDVAELVSIDNAVVATGQQSREDTVNVGMSDSVGPFDYHLTRRLASLCAAHGIPCRRDVFRHYRSDAAAALEAGSATRTALIGFGVDASHGHERTHMEGLVHLASLLTVWLRSGLTQEHWDETPTGPLEEFPSTSVQPSPTQHH